MKLWQTNEKNFASIGFIRSHNNDYCHYPFNKKHLRVQSKFILSLISMFVFTFNIADNPEEYMNAFYMVILLTAIFVSYTTNICGMDTLFHYIDGMESFCNESKWSHKFTNSQMKKAINILETK